MTALQRLPDWQKRLAAELRHSERMPFHAWQNNCGLFTARCVEAITGKFIDRHQWKRTPHETFAALGFEEVAPLMARAGDVVEFESAAGVCIGDRCAFMGAEGLTLVSLGRVHGSWRVG